MNNSNDFIYPLYSAYYVSDTLLGTLSIILFNPHNYPMRRILLLSSGKLKDRRG